MYDFNLRQLEAFVQTVETGSFSAAAQNLFLSQSTVSSHIADLEEALGTVLLERGSRRKVELTRSGREVYTRCSEILSKCADMQKSIAQHGAELWIGASTVPMSCILPKLMAGFRTLHPDCRYVLKGGNSADIHALLLQGQIQIGLVGTVLDRRNMTYRSVFTDRLVLIAPNTEEYRAAKSRRAFGRELLDRPLIVRTPGSGTQMAADAYISGTMLKPPLVARIESCDALLKSVSSGLGCAVVSALAAKGWEESGSIICFELEKTPVERTLYAVCSKHTKPKSLQQQFIEYAVSECAE